MSSFSMAERRLYLCIGLRPDLEDTVRAAVAGGVDVVQLREKVAEAAPIMRAAERLKEICARAGVPFFVNDRVDLAYAVGADGVHLGQGDIPPATAREMLGDDVLIGRSTHAPQELLAALSEPVDYLSAGPVEATPTKPGRQGTGLDYLRFATARSTLPVFVTGGVTPDRVALLVDAGASHFVVVRYVADAPDPEKAARALRTAIDREIRVP
ncbi:MAG: thiamine phosphate synthase [Actinomycetota bacterium]|nr:thiamine phosphate synthase [Actinomycetota bacterium]